MVFIQHKTFAHPIIGQPISLQRGNVDLGTLSLTFHYREWIHDGQKWNWETRQRVLALHMHFRIDKRRGVIELLDGPFWIQGGRWASGDCEEPLLYKSQVKHDRGQRIEFTYEHYTPEEVDDPSSVDLEEIDTVASIRLGYDVKRYSTMPKEKPPVASWDWEKQVAPVEKGEI